jgi:hypothetical protein
MSDESNIWKSLEKDLNKRLDGLGVTLKQKPLIKISVYPELSEVLLTRADQDFSILVDEIDDLLKELTKAKQEINEFGSDLEELEKRIFN